jgi:hypothetical protein
VSCYDNIFGIYVYVCMYVCMYVRMHVRDISTKLYYAFSLNLKLSCELHSLMIGEDILYMIKYCAL